MRAGASFTVSVFPRLASSVLWCVLGCCFGFLLALLVVLFGVVVTDGQSSDRTFESTNGSKS